MSLKISLLSLLSLAAMSVCSPQPQKTPTILKAQAPISASDCYCQCSSVTFRDKYNQVHGNCRRSDSSGAKWCYIANVGGRRSTCQDKFKSTRYPGNFYSYHACSTPALNSATCNNLIYGGGGHHGGGGGGGCHGYNCRDPVRNEITGSNSNYITGRGGSSNSFTGGTFTAGK